MKFKYYLINEEEYVLTIVTKKAIKDAQKRGTKHISFNDIGNHFSPRPKSEAEKLKKKYETAGKYEGNEIDRIFITPESEGVGQN